MTELSKRVKWKLPGHPQFPATSLCTSAAKSCARVAFLPPLPADAKARQVLALRVAELAVIAGVKVT